MKPELVAPVGDWISLKAAIDSKADAVYFGIKELNLRLTTKNFGISDLPKIVNECHKNKIKAYLTLNSIIFDNELDKLKYIIKKAKSASIDAIIAWDLAVIKEANRLEIPIHLSTQASCSNSESALYFNKNLGVKRIILARECTLKQIIDIKRRLPQLEIEVFIHGAMCSSISGRCYLSQDIFNKSANRGLCLQPCRREYLIKDVEDRYELILGKSYVLSAKDLCTMPFIEKLIEAKIDGFKIEGRNRSPEYVKIVTNCYRNAIDFYLAYGDNKEFQKLKNILIKKLKQVYNRGFSPGFYLGKPIDAFANSYGSEAITKKVYVGKVTNFYKKIGVAQVLIETNKLEVKDDIMFQGNKTGVVFHKINYMEINKLPVKEAKKGDMVTIKINTLVRKNDKVYLILPYMKDN